MNIWTKKNSALPMGNSLRNTEEKKARYTSLAKAMRFGGKSRISNSTHVIESDFAGFRKTLGKAGGVQTKGT